MDGAPPGGGGASATTPAHPLRRAAPAGWSRRVARGVESDELRHQVRRDVEFDAEKGGAECLAVVVEAQRPGDPTTQGAEGDEVQGTDAGHLIAFDGAADEAGIPVQEPLGCELTGEDSVEVVGI